MLMCSWRCIFLDTQVLTLGNAYTCTNAGMVSSTNEKVTSQIQAHAPRTKSGNSKRPRLRPKHKHKPTKNIRSLAMSPKNMILASHQMIQWTSSSHSIPSPSEMPHWKWPVCMPNKKGKLRIELLWYSVDQWIQSQGGSFSCQMIMISATLL